MIAFMQFAIVPAELVEQETEQQTTSTLRLAQKPVGEF